MVVAATGAGCVGGRRRESGGGVSSMDEDRFGSIGDVDKEHCRLCEAAS